MSKRVCPNCDGTWGFVTTVHVVEEWVVDAEGHFVQLAHASGPLETVHGPNHGNIWVCCECGSDETTEEK